LVGRRRTTARWCGALPRCGSGGCAAAVFTREGARGDAPKARRVRERHEQGKHSKVGAFTPARSRKAARPWRSTADIRGSGKEQGAHRQRSKARTRMAARNARGPKGLAFNPRTCALRQPRGKGHGGAASGSAGLGARGKRSQRLNLAYQTVCARARACACRGHGHGGDRDGDSDAATGTTNT
jgi:hypothetical protein